MSLTAAGLKVSPQSTPSRDSPFDRGSPASGTDLNSAAGLLGSGVGVIGSGIGDVKEELQQSYKNHAFEFAWHYNEFNAHNLFIQTIISIGVLGLFSILFIFIILMKAAIKNLDLILFSFISLFFFLSLMESTLNVQKGVMFFALFSSVFISLYSKKILQKVI